MTSVTGMESQSKLTVGNFGPFRNILSRLPE
jgi:hypothetical protein